MGRKCVVFKRSECLYTKCSQCYVYAWANRWYWEDNMTQVLNTSVHVYKDTTRNLITTGWFFLIFQVDEELRLTLKENDCGMSTILEPSSSKYINIINITHSSVSLTEYLIVTHGLSRLIVCHYRRLFNFVYRISFFVAV